MNPVAAALGWVVALAVLVAALCAPALRVGSLRRAFRSAAAADGGPASTWRVRAVYAGFVVGYVLAVGVAVLGAVVALDADPVSPATVGAALFPFALGVAAGGTVLPLAGREWRADPVGDTLAWAGFLAVVTLLAAGGLAAGYLAWTGRA